MGGGLTAFGEWDDAGGIPFLLTTWVDPGVDPGDEAMTTRYDAWQRGLDEVGRLIFGGLGVIIAIYLLLNLAFLYVLPLPEIATSKFVGGAAAEALFGARGDAVIRVVMIVSLLGTVNAGWRMNGSVTHVASRSRFVDAASAPSETQTSRRNRSSATQRAWPSFRVVSITVRGPNVRGVNDSDR